jgi:hypothetical protein
MDNNVKKKLLLAILFSALFMVFLLTRIEWGHFSLIAGRLDVKGLAAAFVLFTFCNLIRAVRFNKLDHKDKKFGHWWNINAFYNVVTATLPGGSGEAASAYVMKRFSDLDLLAALRILLMSRLMDLSSISVLFLIAALRISDSTPYRNAALLVSGISFLLSVIVLIPASEQFIMRLLQKLPSGSAFIMKVREKLSELIKVSEEQRGRNVFGIALSQSVFMMILGIISVHMVLRALGIDFSIVQSAYCYGIYMVFQIVPVQGIAGIGTQAAWWMLALNAAGYHCDEMVALGFVLHGIFYLFIAIIGIFTVLAWFMGKKE